MRWTHLERSVREILVLCNPYAGSRDSRFIYNSKLRSMLERAKYQVIYAGERKNGTLLY